MSDKNIEILNDVTKTLIDSCKGYEKACETSGDNQALREEFRRRAQQRSDLVAQFQQEAASLGGDAEADGSMLGAAHRTFIDFAGLFQKDSQAALSAIDDGEENLCEQIQERLEEDGLNPGTRTLLQRAYRAAKEGERFADRHDG